MKQIKPAIGICIFLLATLFAAAQQQYSRVKIHPPEDKLQRANLLGLLEIDHFDMQHGGIIAEINQDQVAKLGRTG